MTKDQLAVKFKKGDSISFKYNGLKKGVINDIYGYDDDREWEVIYINSKGQIDYLFLSLKKIEAVRIKDKLMESVRLNESLPIVVMFKGAKYIRVGCQQISFSVVEKVYKFLKPIENVK